MATYDVWRHMAFSDVCSYIHTSNFTLISGKLSQIPNCPGPSPNALLTRCMRLVFPNTISQFPEPPRSLMAWPRLDQGLELFDALLAEDVFPEENEIYPGKTRGAIQAYDFFFQQW